MTWIEEISPPELPSIFGVLSINPGALETVRQLNEGLAFGNSTLTRVQEEAIATVVSVANRCNYGALTHGGFLRRYTGDPSLACQLLADRTTADVSAKDRRMLDFAVKLTLYPASMVESDVEGLRAAGFEDRDIVSVVLVTCVFNFMNRVAAGLGVEVPTSFQREVEGWLTGPAAHQGWLRDSLGEPVQVISGQDLNPVAAPAQAVQAVPDDNPTTIGAPEQDGRSTNDSTPLEPAEDQPLQRFLDECCLISPGESSTARDLYIAYLRWCDENREGPLLQRTFGLGLTQLGFRRRRRGHGRHWWLGISLKSGGPEV